MRFSLVVGRPVRRRDERVSVLRAPSRFSGTLQQQDGLAGAIVVREQSKRFDVSSACPIAPIREDQSSGRSLHKLHLRLTKVSAATILMSSQLNDEMRREERSAECGTIPMTPILVLTSIFAAGFCCGYGVRAWRSHKRLVRYRLYARYTPSSLAAGRSQHPS